MSTPQQILQKYWQHNSFQGNQEAIIAAVLAQKDTLALLPTGGGKSICFQVPALLMDGVCLVITPLIALMRDQVDNLLKRGIAAVALHSGLSAVEVQEILEDVVSGQYKFLYLSPERLETNLFKAYLEQIDCCLIAVDEAHCVSQWGYDFRPPYLRIAQIRNQLNKVPVIALTASATPIVQEDIIKSLKLKEAAVFKQSFARPNLSYSVFKVDSKINKAIEILKNVAGSSLIYCRSRRETQEIAKLLLLQNISADFYHAGILQEERSQKQQRWIADKTRVIVCTNAFGMGIDKPDVRTVLHLDIPDCLESYYQEAGRGGRDGQKSYAVLLFDETDMRNLKALPDMRFPAIEEIQKVYQALADFLHIPVGAGEDIYYDFDIKTFIKNFQLNAQLVMAALKMLEQEGHLAFNESVFLPSRVQFTTNKGTLEEFERIHPRLDLLVKCLLRNYVGIYDGYVTIGEPFIARTLRLNHAIVVEQLHQLQAYGIIHYSPQKETPQLHFMLNRAPAKYLHLNHQAYFERKRLFEERVDQMVGYTELIKECRGQFIAHYFGDEEAKPCGVCDNCLQQKAANKHSPAIIQQHIQQYLSTESPTIKGLLKHLQFIKKEKVWEVITLLQDEKKLLINDDGNIRLSK